jgi:hypothetical protein
MIQLGLGAVERIVGGVGDVFLGILDGLPELISLHLVEVDSRLGENGKAGRIDLGKTATDEEVLCPTAGEANFKQTWPERGEDA